MQEREREHVQEREREREKKKQKNMAKNHGINSRSRCEWQSLNLFQPN